MPVIDVTFETGALSAEAKSATASQLTEILMEIEGTKDNPTFAAGTWLVLHESAPDSIAVGGQFTPATPRYKIVVTVPEGVLNAERRTAIVERMTNALLNIIGADASNPLQRARVYCLINELKDGAWGFAGQIFTREILNAIPR